MMFNSQNNWICGRCPPSGILNNKETERFGKLMFQSPSERRETHTLLGPLERANVNHWVMFLSDLT
jgi:hypothetical protein